MTTSMQELIDLGGRTAFVTGGARGIGAAIAARLVEAGAEVVVGDLDPEVVELSAAMGARGVVCDVTDPAAVGRALDEAAGDDGLDVLVNNAGIFPTTGPMLDAEDDFVARMLDVNVRALYSVARDAATRMLDGARPGGTMINLASIAALGGGAGISAYSASKAAVVALTRAFANELGPRGIRVNAIAPGVIDTPGVREQMAPLKATGLDIEGRISANPLGRAGQPDDIARATLFLASDLSSFVNGHVVVVDGGAVA
ncbi:MAG: glucose 1-dehydrogenase [Actinomycetota bacterium]